MAKKSPAAKLTDIPATARALVGVGRRDITPPVGIYSRMWGAAKHDVSEGTHRPLSTTALVIRRDKKSQPLVLISADLALLGDLGGDSDYQRIMGPFVTELGIDLRYVMVNCTHTHGSPWTATSRSHLPGGEMLGPYLDFLSRAIIEATREAIRTAVPGTLTWATGRCSLATNRDLPDPEKSKNRVVNGYNPDIKADDTVMVGRVTRDRDDSVLATIVNYACHPTTLAWLNKLISPDYIGTLRQVVEGHTHGAPCLFLQGASGELAPAHQYVGDHAVADKHGRQLGYAVLSTLESMLAPGHLLAYQGVVESGAPLAVWLPEPFDPPTNVDGIGFDIPLPLKPMPSVADMEKQIEACKDRVMRERLFRKLQIVKALGADKTHAMPAWAWLIGRTLFFAHPNEAYSDFQTELRRHFPDYAVVVMNVTGPEMGYLTPAPLHKLNMYQSWQTPFNEKSLDVLIQSCVTQGKALIARANGKGKSSKTAAVAR